MKNGIFPPPSPIRQDQTMKIPSSRTRLRLRSPFRHEKVTFIGDEACIETRQEKLGFRASFPSFLHRYEHQQR